MAQLECYRFDNEEEEDLLCECGRDPEDCAVTEGSDYHMDRDDYLRHGVPAWMVEGEEESL